MKPQTPPAGDIVIRREAGNPGNHYSVREYPGLAQVTYASLEIALEIARRFARTTGTHVWLETDGQFSLLESNAAASMA